MNNLKNNWNENKQLEINNIVLKLNLNEYIKNKNYHKKITDSNPEKEIDVYGLLSNEKEDNLKKKKYAGNLSLIECCCWKSR